MNDEPTSKDLLAAILDLHGAVSLNFDRVDSRLARVDARLDRIEGRLDRVEGRLTRLEGQVAGLQRWTVSADERFERLERAIL